MRCGQDTHASSGGPWWIESFCNYCTEVILRTWITDGMQDETMTRRCDHGLWCWDLKKGLSWDSKTRDLFGYAANAQVTADTFDDAVHPDDRDRVEQAWRYSIEKRNLYEVEYRIWTPDGSLRMMRSEGRCYYDAHGRPLHMMGLCFDVTEHLFS